MVLSLLILCFVVQLIFWAVLFTRILFYQPKSCTHTPTVTVVVSVKNEMKNLPDLVAFLKSQTYVNRDILIINDYSTDGTHIFLNSISGIQVLKPTKDLPGKKHALQEGIQEARGEYILLTDGDCLGNSSDWVGRMASSIGHKKIVLGYGPLLYKNWVGCISAFETWVIAIQYLSYAEWGMPYMGVGRNLLFSKSLFNDNNGFKNHQDLVSGDDDLLIRDIASRQNTAICLNPDSYMYSNAANKIDALISQKKRHLSTAVKYKPYHQFFLTFWSGSLMAFYPLLIIYGIVSGNWATAGTIYIFKIVVQWVIAIAIGYKMKEMRFVLFFPLLDIALSIYYWFLTPFLFYKNKVAWK
jgi:glycosyltransferase involved in cell wall biosynthesis